MATLIDWYKNCQIERRIKQLSLEERQEILEKSPFVACAFQGEGFHVFLKSDPDYYTGYVTSIGEISGKDAEDWIIKRYWEENETKN